MFSAIRQHECNISTSIHMSSNPEPPLTLLSPPYPSGLSQSTDFGCPDSCIKLALAIYFAYGNVRTLCR